ncbi:MAG TPA: type II toxin-antitoxin system RelE/ParE family toxin [Candidatus Acidoferrales bacterium]|nr:type II toxin-antitoxin system RelE/ParE family toxin [Candidatus Acidoferrales bacterium]
MVFIESLVFTRRLRELAAGSADQVLRAIEDDLLANPHRGPMVKGLAGIRKARITNPGRGKGKRGGFRYLYLYLEHRSHVHLLFLLDKNEQDDLNPVERNQLRSLVASIKQT